jgi:hypothetical protein
MMAIIVITLVLANPVIPLAVNQMLSLAAFDPDQDYTDKDVLKCFPFTVKDIMTVLEE